MSDRSSKAPRGDRETSATPGTTTRRPWTLRALSLLVGVSLVLGGLEVIARLLPVHQGTYRLSVNEESPVVRFRPDREFVWSRDWNFSLVNRVRINNFGFVSDFDYDPDAESALLAVIGDSFVEAFMVPHAETCAGRLATRLAGAVRVYSFGAAYSPLSQYLGYAEYVRDTFRPGWIVIVIIENDYDQSLGKYGLRQGMYQFVERSGGRLALKRTDENFRLRYRLVRASALARYVMLNLGLTRGRMQELLRGLLPYGDEPELARQEELDRTRIADSKRAVDAFLDMLPQAAGLDPQRIVFVLDGIRPRVYGEDATGTEHEAYIDVSYVDAMRRYFMAHARRRGYETIDLEPAFVEHYRVHGQRFDWLQDAHWNPLGHEMCSEAVAGSALLSGGLPEVGVSEGAGKG